MPREKLAAFDPHAMCRRRPSHFSGPLPARVVRLGRTPLGPMRHADPQSKPFPHPEKIVAGTRGAAVFRTVPYPPARRLNPVLFARTWARRATRAWAAEAPAKTELALTVPVTVRPAPRFASQPISAARLPQPRKAGSSSLRLLPRRAGRKTGRTVRYVQQGYDLLLARCASWRSGLGARWVQGLTHRLQVPDKSRHLGVPRCFVRRPQNR